MVPTCFVVVAFFFVCLFVFAYNRRRKKETRNFRSREACTTRGIFDSLVRNFSALVSLALKFGAAALCNRA